MVVASAVGVILWIQSMYIKVSKASLTNAGGDGRTALLVALGTTVTGDSCHSILAGALAGRLVTSLPCGSNWMAIACYKEKAKKKGQNIKLGCAQLNNVPFEK